MISGIAICLEAIPFLVSRLRCKFQTKEKS